MRCWQVVVGVAYVVVKVVVVVVGVLAVVGVGVGAAVCQSVFQRVAAVAVVYFKPLAARSC